LIVRDDGRIREVGTAGPLLGTMPDNRWTDRTVTLRDETVLVYTDGVTDTVGENGRLEEQRLRTLLVEGTSTPPSELLGALEAALSRFQVATNRRAEEIASWDPFDSKHGR
jgi:serine phosphatase RsbU (regulator of sigma subunit)